MVTLFVTGCQSTNDMAYNQTTISQTGINPNIGIDPYEASSGYPNPPGPPRGSVKPEY